MGPNQARDDHGPKLRRWKRWPALALAVAMAGPGVESVIAWLTRGDGGRSA